MEVRGLSENSFILNVLLAVWYVVCITLDYTFERREMKILIFDMKA